MQEIVLSSEQMAWCQHAVSALSSEQSSGMAATDADPVTINQVEPLQVEASHRRFYRLICTHSLTLVFMASPPELENNDAFVALAQVFADHHVPVPALIDCDMSAGWMLMSDLGTSHLADVYGTAGEDAAISAALDQLLRISQIHHPAIEVYTAQRMHDELGLFGEWLRDAYLQVAPVTGLEQAFEHLVHATQVQPQCCVHRDFHSRNLLFDGESFGIVDFQDALHGPVLYDVASLLQDCYHEFDTSTVTRWLRHYASQQPLLADIEPDQVQQWFDYTAIQRQLKAVGIFARLHLRDGKDSHLPHILPVMRRTRALCKGYAELATVYEQLTGCINEVLSQPELGSG